MAEKPKKLYRSRTNRWLVGVCGGIGEYFNIDPTVIRVIFVLAFLVLGGGLWVYLILWLIIPLEPEDIDMVVSEPAEAAPAEEPPAEDKE